MRKNPDLMWHQYQSAFNTVVSADNAERLEDLGLRVARVVDVYPLVALFYKMLKRARLDLARHIKQKDSTDKDKLAAWTVKFLSLSTVLNRSEGALAAFLTVVEATPEDLVGQLKLRCQSVVELIQHAHNKGLLVFPQPEQFSLIALVGELTGKTTEEPNLRFVQGKSKRRGKN